MYTYILYICCTITVDIIERLTNISYWPFCCSVFFYTNAIIQTKN